MKLVFLFLFICPALILAARSESKFQFWETSGFFRGFNSGYWSSHDDYAKTLEDITAMKDTGANLIKLKNTSFKPVIPINRIPREFKVKTYTNRAHQSQ